MKHKGHLHYSAERGDLAGVKKAISSGKEHISDVDELDRTALHYAVAKSDNVDLVAYLVEAGADVHAKDSFQRCCHHYCAYDGRVKCLEFLLKHGIGVDEADATGRTPLHLAAKNGSIDCICLLVENKASLTCKDEIGEDFLCYAAHRGRQPILHLEELKQILGDRLSLETKGARGNTILTHSAVRARLYAVEECIENGCNVHHKNDNGETAWDLLDRLPKTPKLEATLAMLKAAMEK